MPLSDAQQAILQTFIASLADVRWLDHAGEAESEGAAIVAADFLEAWDDWHTEMMAAWLPQTKRLELLAAAELGDAAIDAVFLAVSAALDEPLRTAMQWYFDTRSTDELNADRGLWHEWLDAIQRDLAWAAVEAVLQRPGFFTDLLPFYRAGRWPCAWEDGDRAKRVVLL